MIARSILSAGLILASLSPILLGSQEPELTERRDSISVRLVDVDLRAAMQALGRYLDRPLLFGSLPPIRLTFDTPVPLPRSEILPLLRGLAAANGLELALDSTGTFYRIAERTMARALSAQRTQQAEGSPNDPSLASAGGLQLFVIRLRHARAADVAGSVNALYGRAAALGELGSPARPSFGTLDQGLRQNTAGVSGQGVPEQGAVAQGTPRPPSESLPNQGRGVGMPGGRSAILTGDVTIVPDERTNALLVRASRPDYDLVNAAVEQLDVRPLQVLIEVLIAEVRRDRDLSFGLSTDVRQTALPGDAGGTLGGSVGGASNEDFVMRLLDFTIGTAQLNATLRAAASRGDVRIVSRPVVIATNNELSEILVGSQRPFIQVQRSLPSDAPSRDQVVQYRDVGTRLIVRPTISEDGYVMIAVTQEVNAATTETAFDAPVISTRSVQTQLLVKDRQTVVLGGLIDHQRDQLQAGVPFLSAIPWIGGLFGRSVRRTRETELFVFITPKVIRDDAEADSLTMPMRERSGVKEAECTVRRPGC